MMTGAGWLCTTAVYQTWSWRIPNMHLLPMICTRRRKVIIIIIIIVDVDSDSVRRWRRKYAERRAMPLRGRRT